MRTVNGVLALCGLALLAGPACKKQRDHDESTDISPKSVEKSEKEAMNASGDVNEQRKDVNDAERDVNKQQGELRDAERNFAVERDEFVSKAQAKLSQLDARIDALRDDYRAGAKHLKADTRKDVGELMEKIDTERAKVRTAFDAAANGAKDRWDDLSKNTGEALNDLENTVDDAHSKLKDAGVKVRDEADAILHR